MSDFPLTLEQQEALRLFQTGESLAIEAGAGTGKTSTLIALAESCPNRRGQYIAFNRAIVNESKGMFPRNVQCNTAHSLAMRAVGHQFRHRLDSPRMKSMDLANRLRLDPITLDVTGERKLMSRSYLAGLTMRAVLKFCQSADLEIGARHVPYIDGIDVPPVVNGERVWTNNRIVARHIESAIKRAWEDLSRPDGSLKYEHDHYLKTWHLSGPRIGSDFILFDEAQDANPVLVAIIQAQTHAQLVWVGDSQQAIYAFTGAVNALASVDSDSRTFLTQSWRFGQGIADEANLILERIPGAELRLVGNPALDSTVDAVADPAVVLTRTNAEAVRTVLDAITDEKKPHLVGGGKEIVSFTRAAWMLILGDRVDHPELACFESWAEVQHYVETDEQGGDLRLMVKLIDDFGPERILEALDGSVAEKDADVVVSTAHKSKGRQWASVKIASDFQEDPAKMTPEEWRLLYVAVTRAQLRLDITGVAVLSPTGFLPASEPEVGLPALPDSAERETASTEPGVTVFADDPPPSVYAAALARELNSRHLGATIPVKTVQSALDALEAERKAS